MDAVINIFLNGLPLLLASAIGLLVTYAIFKIMTFIFQKQKPKHD